MTGELSQLITLCSAANGFLAGRFDPTEFFPDNPTFKFCNRVKFVEVKKRMLRGVSEVDIAKSPNEWLSHIARSSASKAIIFHASSENPTAPDHKLVAFVGGGGDWSLFLVYPSHCEQWMARWDVTNQDAADQRIWSVTYGCVAKSTSAVELSDVNLPDLSKRFAGTLARAQSFAEQHDLDGFGQCFRLGREALRVDSPVAFPDYVDFVCLDCYPDIAQRLLAASYASWVFGGMGSWNDLWFEHKAENDIYEDISAQLYTIINEAAQAATNAFSLPRL